MSSTVAEVRTVEEAVEPVAAVEKAFRVSAKNIFLTFSQVSAEAEPSAVSRKI